MSNNDKKWRGTRARRLSKALHGSPPPEQMGVGTKTLKSGTLTFDHKDIPTVTEGKSAAMDFSHALLNGNPVAQAMAEKAMQEDAPSLADKFVASTYNWCKFFRFTAKEEKASLPVVMAYRQAMRLSNRFMLDDDFVRYSVEVANRTKPEKLLYRLQYCTLPYDKTWIEFDLRVKVRAMRAYHGLQGIPEGVSPRCGLLLERVDNQLATVTIVNEAENFGDLSVPNFSGYLFSLDERHLPYNRTYNGMTPYDMTHRFAELGKIPAFADIVSKPDAQDIMRRVTRGSMWGYGNNTGMIESGRVLLNNITLPGYLERHGEMAFSRFYDFFEFAKGEFHRATEQMAELVNREVVEFTGMLRWIVCVLAMLNEVPTVSDLIKPMHTMRAGLVRRVPAMDYHRVSLKLPKTKPVPWIERHLSNVERKHKAHEVRSHWRTYLSELPCQREEHTWEYDYEEGYRLCNCMSFSRLIHEHVRGDPSLGWVKKEYVLQPSKQD